MGVVNFRRINRDVSILVVSIFLKTKVHVLSPSGKVVRHGVSVFTILNFYKMKLLETYQLGPFTLRNRVVMAPMTRNRLTAEGLAGTLAAEYYHQRATMGLLISEAVAISADAIGYPMIPGLYNKAQVESWRGITDRVHDAGGLIFAQL